MLSNSRPHINTDNTPASSTLRVEPILFTKNKKQIKHIYTNAFSKNERMPFGLMLAMSCLFTTKFFAFYDSEILCGLLYMGKIGKQAFILFFAVEEELRSKGYGSRILSTIKETYPKCKIVVSIEPCDQSAPDFELRQRRKKFYLRNGFTDSMYNLKLNGIEQEIMISGGKFNRRRFSAFLLAYSCFAIRPNIWRRK